MQSSPALELLARSSDITAAYQKMNAAFGLPGDRQPQQVSPVISLMIGGEMVNAHVTSVGADRQGWNVDVIVHSAGLPLIVRIVRACWEDEWRILTARPHHF